MMEEVDEVSKTIGAPGSSPVDIFPPRACSAYFDLSHRIDVLQFALYQHGSLVYGFHGALRRGGPWLQRSFEKLSRLREGRE